MSIDRAEAILLKLLEVFAAHISAEALPAPTGDGASTKPVAAGFEAPDGFATITGQYGAAFGDEDSRISAAYPNDWTALDASEIAFARVLDISRRKAASDGRWHGSSDDSNEDSDATMLYEPDDVNIQVAGPGMIHTRSVGGISPIDGIDAEDVKSRVQDATGTESLSETTIGGSDAASMTVEGTSADGYTVRQRMVWHRVQRGRPLRTDHPPDRPRRCYTRYDSNDRRECDR